MDLAGALLDGEDFQGWGIYVHDCADVEISNGVIKGLFYGIRAVRVERLGIRNCVVSDNHNPRDTGWLGDTLSPAEAGYGGGVYLLEGNAITNNFNGIRILVSNKLLSWAAALRINSQRFLLWKSLKIEIAPMHQHAAGVA